jgi:hypothetical protein
VDLGQQAGRQSQELTDRQTPPAAAATRQGLVRLKNAQAPAFWSGACAVPAQAVWHENRFLDPINARRLDMMPITKKSIAIDGRIFPDRRRELRHRVLKGAKLSFNNGYGASECVVRNLSDRGAKLAFGDTLGVPPRFRLQIAADAVTHEAVVCWRGIGEIGVRFT